MAALLGARLEGFDDLAPVQQEEGPLPPVCAISYSDHYTSHMDTLRALKAANEVSERGLKLTKDIIEMSPAHYTTWQYRRRCLRDLSKDLREEIAWIDMKAEENPKNYQLWYHRRCVVQLSGDASAEHAFVNRVFQEDAKNYHAWAHRQWVCQTFGLWEGEMEVVGLLLQEDLRNNRWFIVHNCGTPVTLQVVVAEVSFALDNIYRAPNNESPWNYIRGFFLSRPFSDVPELQRKCEALLESPLGRGCAHAHKLLAQMREAEGGEEGLRAAMEHLGHLTALDPLRAKYWERRRETIRGKQQRALDSADT